VGAAKRLSAVRWGVAGNMIVAWILTLPAAGAMGALIYGLARIFGTGATGPVIIAALMVAALSAVFLRRLQLISVPSEA
jgi:PiT family inorganic phosphate transporter